jgi:hypothetical protein
LYSTGGRELVVRVDFIFETLQHEATPVARFHFHCFQE